MNGAGYNVAVIVTFNETSPRPDFGNGVCVYKYNNKEY